MTVGQKSVSAGRAAPRRGLSRVEVAIYIGISPSKFDQMVADGRMPRPRRIDGRKIWDVHEVDCYFDDLPRERLVNGLNVGVSRDSAGCDGREDFRK